MIIMACMDYLGSLQIFSYVVKLKEFLECIRYAQDFHEMNCYSMPS